MELYIADGGVSQYERGREMLSLLGIVVGLALFILLAYIGYNTIIVAIAAGMVVAIFGGMNPFTLLTEAFMPKAVGFMQGYFLIFLFSALFARFMGDTGAAPSIAVKVARIAKKAKNRDVQRWLAVMVLPLIQLILTYGGVNVFVVVFILVAIARSLFKELDIPWWMYTCSSLGSSTVTIGMLPGSPQIQNIIPTEYFGSTTMAAPVLGILCAIITFGIGSYYVWWQCRRTNKKGESFLPTGELINKEQLVEIDLKDEKPLWQCLLPMIVVIVVLNVLKQSAVIALFSGCVVAWLLYDPRKQSLKKVFAGAMPQAIMPLVTVCCASGFGGMVAAVPGFQNIVASLDKLGTNPLTIVLIVNICSGICGSASSGENIALQNFADRFIATGIPGPQLHRLVAMSSIGLDTLPHSAGIITMLSTTKLTHRQGYINSFVLSLVLPILMACFAAVLISMGFYW